MTRTSLISVREMQYADDVAVAASSTLELQESLNDLNLSYRRVSLRIIAGKTEVMSRGEEREEENPRLVVHGVQLPEVEHFAYLESIISSSGTVDREVQIRYVGQTSLLAVSETRSLLIGISKSSECKYC